MSGIAILLLAAGRGTRFGAEPKLLARLDGRPLVRHAAEAALASSLRPILAVTGHAGDDVAAALAGLGLTLVANASHAEGLSTSLRAGFAALPADVDGVIVMLGDMPRIGAGLLDGLAHAWRAAGRPDALVPTWSGRRGNPVLLARRLAPEIAALTGDTGAGPLLRDRPGVVEWPVAEEAVGLDIDTPAALAAAQASTTPSSTAE